MGANGNGNGHAAGIPMEALLNGDRYTISTGQRWKCPACGVEPKNAQPGIPEGLATQLENDERQYHCGPCYQKWQSEKMVQEIRENVPRLVPLES